MRWKFITNRWKLIVFFKETGELWSVWVYTHNFLKRKKSIITFINLFLSKKLYFIIKTLCERFHDNAIIVKKYVHGRRAVCTIYFYFSYKCFDRGQFDDRSTVFEYQSRNHTRDEVVSGVSDGSRSERAHETNNATSDAFSKSSV